MYGEKEDQRSERRSTREEGWEGAGKEADGGPQAGDCEIGGRDEMGDRNSPTGTGRCSMSDTPRDLHVYEIHFDLFTTLEDGTPGTRTQRLRTMIAAEDVPAAIGIVQEHARLHLRERFLGCKVVNASAYSWQENGEPTILGKLYAMEVR